MAELYVWAEPPLGLVEVAQLSLAFIITLWRADIGVSCRQVQAGAAVISVTRRSSP